MTVLVDTQVFIWFFENNSRLPSPIKLYMEQSNNLVVSIASFWEISIKASLGKLIIPENIASLMDNTLSKGFKILPIEREHLITLSSLDMIHRNPFDRIIIAQAITENMSLVSSDAVFQEYPVNCIWK
jgi:PIN domain nuclease of toxin-antitoxin system